MPETVSYDYAVIRVVPRVDREEFINAGVILFCAERNYLAARVHLDPNRVTALWPEADTALLWRHLEAIPRICAGEPEAGPIATLRKRERFHWLTSPRSTMIQVSTVHNGLCEGPEALLDDLFEKLVDGIGR